MNGNFLLDTNIIIALFERDEAVIENIKVANQINR